MSAKTIVAALVALAACTGCATSTHRTVAQTPSDVVIVRDDGVLVHPSPMMGPADSNWRSGGWDDTVARRTPRGGAGRRPVPSASSLVLDVAAEDVRLQILRRLVAVDRVPLTEL